MIQLPEPQEMPVSCNSWIATSPNGDKVFETFDKTTAINALSAGWHVVTAYQHLTGLNKNENTSH